jgi:hypothetical protein
MTRLLVARHDDLYQELRHWLHDLSTNESQHSPNGSILIPD